MGDEEKAKNVEVRNSIFELAKQLESKSINPSDARKGDLKKCADLFKSRGYSNADIAEILEVDEKTVQRYIKDQREENALAISSNFQKQMVGEIVRDWHKQYYRLLRLSYSEGMTANEVMKAIYLAHQVEKDGVELLERLGYLSKTRAIEDIKKALEFEQEESLYNLIDEDLRSKLNSIQHQEMLDFIRKRCEGTYKEAIKMINDFAEENKKRN